MNTTKKYSILLGHHDAILRYYLLEYGDEDLLTSSPYEAVGKQDFFYLVEHVGIDGVALGSDFDGATIPQEIGDVSGLPRLMAALASSGYDESALQKIAHENWIRVLRKTWHD